MIDAPMPLKDAKVQVHTSEVEAVLTDPTTGSVYKLNPTALAIWELCDGKTTFEEATSTLADLTDQPASGIASDIRETVEEFRDLGLVH